MSDRTCAGCGVSIEHLITRAKYCSNACRSWVRAGHPGLRVPQADCSHCGQPMVGKKLVTAIYCSRSCKLAASEKRRPKRDDAARYLREREYRIEAAKAYYKRRPEVAQLTKRKRRARLRDAGVFVITERDWRRLCDRYDNRCCYCRENRPLTFDHVIPVIRGGRHSIGNALPACASCNASKNRRTVMEWRVSKLRRG